MYLYELTHSYSQLVGCLLLINVVLALKIGRTQGFGKSEQWILKLIAIGSLCSISDMLCVVSNGHVNRLVFYIYNGAFFITYALSLLSLFEYTLKRYFGVKQSNKLLYVVNRIPVILIIILTVVSYWTGWAFSINSNGIYIRGPLYIFYVALGFLYVVAILILAIVYLIRNRENGSIDPLVYFLPLGIAPLVQFFVPDFPVASIGLTISFLFIVLNNQEYIIRRSNDRNNLIASLSSEFESIFVIDLDIDKFYFLRTTLQINEVAVDQTIMNFTKTVNDVVNTFVVPDGREELLKNLSVENLKKKMLKNTRFSYRFAILPNENNKYVYEMHLVNVSKNSQVHVLVAGTKCIDSTLKYEREEGQYNAALLHDCTYFFDFDVSTGYFDGEYKSLEDYTVYEEGALSFPILYDDFTKYRIEEYGFVPLAKEDARYWTCQGLNDAYKEGKRTVEVHYRSTKTDEYWNGIIILSQDPLSKHLHAIYICRNITEQIKNEKKQQNELEKALIQAKQANAAKSAFLTRMSHDIRTPLNGIIGIMEINEKHKDDIQLVNENRVKAKIAANHLLSLINDILDMSKLEDSQLTLPCEPVNLKEICAEAFTICSIRAKENGITPMNDGAINLVHPIVYSSPLHLKQIFMNILNNGIKYNKKGGSISCISRMDSFDGENVVYSFIIKDSGIGMSEDFITHIFEPFSQEKKDARSRYQGSGMGMTIVKALVDKMNGIISVTSQVNVGSTFVVTIPFKICKENVKIGKTSDIKQEKTIEGMRILVVEDNELNMEIIKCILEDEGAVLTLANNGQEAVTCYADKQAGSFDAILMDVMMPVVDGYEATRIIRQMDKSDAGIIPIIAMTANAFEEDKQEAYNAGMNDHIAKPINVKELLGILGKIYNR